MNLKSRPQGPVPLSLLHEPVATMDQLCFETVPAEMVAGLGSSDTTIQRARVPGGWIVLYDEGKRVRFCPCTAPATDLVASKFTATRCERELNVVG